MPRGGSDGSASSACSRSIDSVGVAIENVCTESGRSSLRCEWMSKSSVHGTTDSDGGHNRLRPSRKSEGLVSVDCESQSGWDSAVRSGDTNRGLGGQECHSRTSSSSGGSSALRFLSSISSSSTIFLLRVSSFSSNSVFWRLRACSSARFSFCNSRCSSCRRKAASRS